MQDVPRLGKLLDEHERRRDAIHIAIAPVTAAERLSPGQHVGLVRDGIEFVGTVAEEDQLGIVDPFLTEPIEEGQRFWMFLYQESITSLRHYWAHPQFSSAAQLRRRQGE